MRKKSHIKLASVIFDMIDDKSLNKYKLYFKVGAILPDIVPTFLWKKHRIDTTREEFERTVRKFIYGVQVGRMHSLRAGVITHYLSDYFTYPHNKECKWNLLKHNSYEGSQLKQIRLLSLDDIKKLNPVIQNINSLEDLFEMVERLHNEYIRKIQCRVADWLDVDMEYIEYVSLSVMEILLCNRAKLLGVGLDQAQVLA